MIYHLQLRVADRWLTVERGSFLAVATIRRSRERRFPKDLYRVRLAVA